MDSNLLYTKYVLIFAINYKLNGYMFCDDKFTGFSRF